LADFPHFDQAPTTCNGSKDCWQTAETQWRSVSRDLIQKLESKGFVVQALDLEDDTGRRVYEVSKDGKAQYYLNLFSTDKGTVYLIAKEPLDREELNKAVAPQ
jgi:hypothetical protein